MTKDDPFMEMRVTATAFLFAFVVMKLGGLGLIADWSWWWVMSPMWITALLSIPIVAVRAILAGRRRK